MSERAVIMDDDKAQFLTYLGQIYEQANEHLREQEHKRDQVVTFYAVLISFFITTSNAIQKNFGGHGTMFIVDIGLFLIGWLCVKTVADLRGWHKQYLDVIYVLNYVIVRQRTYRSVDELKDVIHAKIVEDQSVNDKDENKKVKLSTEDGVFWATLIFSLAPLFMILHTIYTLFGEMMNHSDQQMMIVAVGVIFTALGLLYLYQLNQYMRDRVAKANTYKTWMLDFDYYSDSSTRTRILADNRYYTVSEKNSLLLVAQKSAGVVILAEKTKRILLIRIKRVDGQLHWELPRGFVEPEEIQAGAIHFADAARRELHEELNIDVDASKFNDLGEIMPDSGFIKSYVHVVHAQLEDVSLDQIRLQNDEGIRGEQFFDLIQLKSMIHRGEIIDGFTLGGVLKVEGRL